jgi:aryl-alcohol dehydrogenase-like predicted oxidoreductase
MEDRMQTVTLGASHLKVTPIAYGTWQFSGDWGPVDEQAAVAAITRARSAGINFFDTAQAYGFGRSERLLGRALAAELRSARDTVVIATKGGLRMDGDQLVRDAAPPGCGKASRPAWRRWAPTTSTCTKCTGPTRPRRSARPRPRWPN